MKIYKVISVIIILPVSLIVASCQANEIKAINNNLTIMQTSIAGTNQLVREQKIIAADTPTEASPVLGKVMANDSAVKLKPDNQSETLETLFAGEIIKIIDIDAGRKWVLVQTPVGSQGWVDAQQIFTAVDLKTFEFNTQVSKQAAVTETAKAVDSVNWSEAGVYIGEYKTICGPVIDSNYATSTEGAPTFLNIGKAYPEPGRFTVLIWENNRANFPSNPETFYIGKTICVYGLIQSDKGAPEIEASKSNQIQTQ